MEEEYYIAYLIPDEVPKTGMTELFFYTKKGDEYYLGTGNNSFNQKFMDNLESKNKIIKLPKLIRLKRWTGIGLDETGKVYFGNISDIINYKPFGLNNLKCLEGIILK